MRIILLFIFLALSTNGFAQEVKTAFFTLVLPDSFYVESDNRNLLLAFGGDGPSDLPFLSIEFGKDMDIEEEVSNLNYELQEFNKKLVEEPCAPACRAYYAELTTAIEETAVYRYHYIAQSERLGFIISYGDFDSLQSGRKFVKDIARQIRGSGN